MTQFFIFHFFHHIYFFFAHFTHFTAEKMWMVELSDCEFVNLSSRKFSFVYTPRRLLWSLFYHICFGVNFSCFKFFFSMGEFINDVESLKKFDCNDGNWSYKIEKFNNLRLMLWSFFFSFTILSFQFCIFLHSLFFSLSFETSIWVGWCSVLFFKPLWKHVQVPRSSRKIIFLWFKNLKNSTFFWKSSNSLWRIEVVKEI